MPAPIPASRSLRVTGAGLAAGAPYVALGSSFAAGSGITPEGPECGRSGRNYPSLVAAELDLDLVDVSCGGATTANVISTPQGMAPPQIEAVTADTALVTVTIGGNDVGYIGTAFACSDPATRCASPSDEADFLALEESLGAMVRELRGQRRRRQRVGRRSPADFTALLRARPTRLCERLQGQCAAHSTGDPLYEKRLTTPSPRSSGPTTIRVETVSPTRSRPMGVGEADGEQPLRLESVPGRA